jgi:endoglucanase
MKYLYGCLFLNFFTTLNAWTINQGIIYDNYNKTFNLSGISWFGFETQDFVINGLWSHDYKWYIDCLKKNHFNVIRIPFSAEWILYNFDLYPYNQLVIADSFNQNKKSIEILDNIFNYAEKNNIYIMLDLHRLHKEYISELWYSPTDNLFTSDDFLLTWFKILDRYHNKSNLIAIDLLNEPHGLATWGDSNPSTDWNKFVEYVIPKISNRYPNSTWLFLVEGIGWGKDLSNVRNFPIQLSQNISSRLSYSAHTYGKSVVSSVDPFNKFQLYQDWDINFGFLKSLDYSYIIGEYGGITEIDAVWMNSLVDYLIENNMRNAFFWSLGPNSGDVKGFLLDDWTNIDYFKANITMRLQPFPTF